MTPFIAGIGGTLRERSYSRAALNNALPIAQRQGAEVELLDLRALDLPMYVPDLLIEDYPANRVAAVTRLMQTARRAQALIWSSPTYHGTVSGVFKNALDMLELLGDDDPPYLSGKAVGLIAVSDSQTFSAMASSVHELRGWLAPTYLTLDSQDFNPDLSLKPGPATRRAERLVGELLEFVAYRTQSPILSRSRKPRPSTSWRARCA